MEKQTESIEAKTDVEFAKYMLEAGMMVIKYKFPQSDLDTHIKYLIAQWHRWQREVEDRKCK